MPIQMFPGTREEVEKQQHEGWQAEHHLLRFLVTELGKQKSNYRIYYQPRINGMKPDIVVVNDDWGLIVFEVKDWNLSHYRFEGKHLIGTFDGKDCRVRDPREQAKAVADRIFEQFLGVEEPTRKLGEDSNAFQICLHAVYFHGQPTEVVETLFGKYAFGGGETNVVLCPGKLTLEAAVPWTKYNLRRSKHLTPAQSDALGKLHRWLAPPPSEQPIENLKLSKQQASVINPEAGFHRVRGAAGSGKSIVLAKRAAKASREGAVLMTCFNITMAHHLRDMIKRHGESPVWQDITVRHYHGFMHDLESDEDIDQPPAEKRWEVTTKRVMEGAFTSQCLFRGIYVDEGQDFEPEWVDALSKLLAPEGELVLVADYRQKIYTQAGAGDMRRHKAARFDRPWRQLSQTYRLYPRVAYLLQELENRFALRDEHDPKLADFPSHDRSDELFRSIQWRNCASLHDAHEHLLAHLNRLPHPESIAILVRDHQTGLALVKWIETRDARYSPVSHIFSEQGPDSAESKRRKHAFWMGGGALKVCTLHSFKGWEIPNVVVLWTADKGDRNPIQELYVGISRVVSGPDVESSLLVLNVDREFDDLAACEAFA